MNLKQAFSWTVVSVVLRYAIKLLGNLTLARLLAPHDFGLSAIVLAVVTGLETITDVGTRPALIRTHRNDDAWLDTAWTLGLVRGIAIGVVIAVCAVPLAAFFEEPALAPMIAVTGTMSVLIGLTSITAVLVVRDLQMKRLSVLEILAAIAGYVVMLTWAWVAPSAWALLAGAVVSTGAFTVVSHLFLARRRLKLRWDRAVVAELVGFGKWVFMSSLLGFFIFQGDRFSVAKLVSVSAAGLYAIAATWALSLQSVFFMFLSRLYLPVAAQLWRTHGGPNPQLLSLRRHVLVAMIVPYAFGAGCAVPLITYLYPGAYDGAGPIMAILVAGAWFATLEYLYNDQLMVAGEPSWRFYAQLVSVPVIGAALFAFAGSHDAEGVALAFSAGALLRAAILSYAADRHSLRAMMPDLALTFAFIGLALVVFKAATMLSLQFSPLVALVVCFAVLAPVGALVGWLALRNVFRLASGTGAIVQPSGVEQVSP